MRVLLLLAATQAIFAQSQIGLASGSVIAGGGGGLGSSIWQRFVSLAGGPESLIIVIPTAREPVSAAPDTERLHGVGAKNIGVRHTTDRKVADSEEFVEPLKRARGVWISGGRQHHLVDSYLNTRTVTELRSVLARGGVVGGSSAGASILGSYLIRGGDDNDTVMAPGYEQGFGLLRGLAIDQHLLARQRETDMLDVIAAHPHLLGVGIDEQTAVVVQGDWMEVLGPSKVAIYEQGKPYFFLANGARYNLRTRTRPPSATNPSPRGLAMTVTVAVCLAVAGTLFVLLRKYFGPA
jgi:cyanophycinase